MKKKRERKRERERGVIYWLLSNCGTGTYGDRVARGSQRVREKEGEREREDSVRARARRREKREREEKALSRSFSLSISTASPAFHGHESIPRDRRRVGRSSLSTSSRRSLHSCTITRRVDFSSRTGAYLCVFSPSPSSSSSSSSLSLSLSLSSSHRFFTTPRRRRNTRERVRYAVAVRGRVASFSTVACRAAQSIRSMRAVEAARDRESKRCTLAAGGRNTAK